MEEADRVGKKIAIVDHDQIIVQGTTPELKQQTRTASLEDGFLALASKTICEEERYPAIFFSPPGVILIQISRPK